jgi:hypothetical protein
MAERVEITSEQLALILEALEDAAFYRDTRSRVLKSAVKRSSRRLVADAEGAGADVHRTKAKAYTELALRLRRGPASPA